MNAALRLCNAVCRSARQLGSLISLRQCNLFHTTSSRGILRQPRQNATVDHAVESKFNADGSLKCIGVDNERGMLAITWANGETADFHAVWLRHNCQCPSCITSSNQKTIYPSMLNPNVAITSTNISGLL